MALGVGILTLGALRLGMGARWFSFYGVATVVLLVTPPVAAALARRLAVQGFPRWPAWALAVVTCLAALAQIGYWAAFFNGGPAVTLGIVRGMVQEYAGPFLPWALIAWGLALLWLLARALGRDFAPR